jgi:hypothetical protein
MNIRRRRINSPLSVEHPAHEIGVELDGARADAQHARCLLIVGAVRNNKPLEFPRPLNLAASRWLTAKAGRIGDYLPGSCSYCREHSKLDRLSGGEIRLMAVLRMFLVAFAVALAAYTAIVISNHGWNLFPVFFGDILAMNWAGQFNFDFSGFLVLSALWTAWRNDFSPLGLVLAVVAFFGGMGFLAIYLLILSARANTIGELVAGPQAR